MVVRTGNKSGSIGGFLKRTQRTLLDTPWQIIQVMETGQPGNLVEFFWNLESEQEGLVFLCIN